MAYLYTDTDQDFVDALNDVCKMPRQYSGGEGGGPTVSFTLAADNSIYVPNRLPRGDSVIIVPSNLTSLSDCTSEVQAIIDSAPNSIIRFEPGTYNVTSLDMSNRTVDSEVPGKAIIKGIDNSLFSVVNVTNSNKFSIKNISIAGSGYSVILAIRNSENNILDGAFCSGGSIAQHWYDNSTVYCKSGKATSPLQTGPPSVGTGFLLTGSRSIIDNCDTARCFTCFQSIGAAAGLTRTELGLPVLTDDEINTESQTWIEGGISEPILGVSPIHEVFWMRGVEGGYIGKRYVEGDLQVLKLTENTHNLKVIDINSTGGAIPVAILELCRNITIEGLCTGASSLGFEVHGMGTGLTDAQDILDEMKITLRDCRAASRISVALLPVFYQA